MKVFVTFSKVHNNKGFNEFINIRSENNQFILSLLQTNFRKIRIINENVLNIKVNRSDLKCKERLINILNSEDLVICEKEFFSFDPNSNNEKVSTKLKIYKRDKKEIAYPISDLMIF